MWEVDCGWEIRNSKKKGQTEFETTQYHRVLLEGALHPASLIQKLLLYLTINIDYY